MSRFGIVILAWLVSSLAIATTSGVPGVNVKPGDRSTEYRSAVVEPGKGRPSAFAHRLHYQHAFNDSYRLRFAAQQTQREGQSIEFDSARFELLWQYQEKSSNQGGAAFRFDLQIAEGDDEPHFARVSWIKEFAMLDWDWRFNAFVGRDFGDDADSGLSLATRGQVSRKFSEYRLGIQYLGSLNQSNDMGRFNAQRHQLGVFASRSIGEYEIFAGYLNGVTSRAPEHTYRLFLSRSL